MPEIIAFTLRRLRKAKGFSLEQLAEKARVDKQTIWRLEQDEHTNAREHTVEKLARALSVEPGVLTGKTAAPETEDGGAYYLMSKLNFRVSTDAHNALCLVADRYHITHQEIVELAPFLFYWAAETSLQQRRERLKQAERARESARDLERKMKHLPAPDFTPSEERFVAESESIDRRDIFGKSLDDAGFGLSVRKESTDNPFAIFLYDLVKDIGSDVMFERYSGEDYPEYRVCAEDASRLVEDDSELAEHILGGHIALSEMPREIAHGYGAGKDRVEWVRARVDEYRKNMLRFIEQSRHNEASP